MQYFITVFVYCILREQYLASTLTDSVGEGAASQRGDIIIIIIII